MSTSASRTDLIQAVANDLNMTKAQAKLTVDSVIENIKGFAENTGITIRDFGKFEVRTRAARTVKSGVTGSRPVQVPSREALVFRCSKALRSKAL